MGTTETVAGLLIAGGAAWTLLGTLGLLRFPDVYTRLHATSLGSTGGIALVLLGVVIHFAPRSASISLLAALTLVFVMLSYPLATTAIISAAYRIKVPKYEGTIVDELENETELDAQEGL